MKNKILMLTIMVLTNLYLVNLMFVAITGNNHDHYFMKIMDDYYMGDNSYLDKPVYLELLDSRYIRYNSYLGEFYYNQENPFQWGISRDIGFPLVYPVQAYNCDESRKIVYGKTFTKYFITPDKSFSNQEDWNSELVRIGIANGDKLLIPADVVSKFPKTEVCLYYYDAMSGLFGMDDLKWVYFTWMLAALICLWTGFILKGKKVSYLIFSIITVLAGIACLKLFPVGTQDPDQQVVGICLFCFMLYLLGRILNWWYGRPTNVHP